MSDPFAPLGGGGGRAERTGGRAKPDLVAVFPVPDDAPSRPTRHPKLGAPSSTWTYLDAAGRPLGYVNRFDGPDGKEFRPLVLFRDPAGKMLWKWESWPAPRPLYGLDRLAATPEAPVVLCEGEKAADAATKLLPGHVAVCSPNGSKSAGKADWSVLRGRDVVIWPDADLAGDDYARASIMMIWDAGAVRVSILTPPDGVATGWDAADALAEGWTRNDALGLVRAAQAARAPSRGGNASPKDETASGAAGEGQQGPRRRVPQRDSLMGLTTLCDLWHGPDGDAYCTFPVNAHHESWPIRSSQFKRWISSKAYEELGLVPGNQAVEDTLRILEARATNEGPERTPWLRVGSEDGRIYLDLGDKAWRVVEIRPTGWSVLERHSLPFVRSPSMRPLPEPEGGSMIESLRRFVNVASDDDFTLVTAWLVAALRPGWPYPILVVGGEQGAGKSTFSRLVRSIVDPNMAPIRAAPKDERDLMVAAHNAHIVCLDNLSHVSNDLSDALARLSTGGALSTRKLHTDAEEMIFVAKKPIILNGIPSLTDRADLASRSITIRLCTIPENERRTEEEFWKDWDNTAPQVLGALCDALSCALRRHPETRLPRLSRMADFALWVTAAEEALGWEEGAFMAAYTANERTVVDGAFEASPVAVAIRELMTRNREPWHGTAAELLASLVDLVTEAVKRSRAWPLTAQALGNAIDRAAPLLRAKGLTVTKRHSGIRTIAIAWSDAALSSRG